MTVTVVVGMGVGVGLALWCPYFWALSKHTRLTWPCASEWPRDSTASSAMIVIIVIIIIIIIWLTHRPGANPDKDVSVPINWACKDLDPPITRTCMPITRNPAALTCPHPCSLHHRFLLQACCTRPPRVHRRHPPSMPAARRLAHPLVLPCGRPRSPADNHHYCAWMAGKHVEMKEGPILGDAYASGAHGKETMMYLHFTDLELDFGHFLPVCFNASCRHHTRGTP